MGLAAAAAVTAVVLVAAAVQGATGIGFALVAVPLLSVAALDASQAVVVANALGLVTSGTIAVRGRHQVDRPVARRLLLGALAGTPLGLVVIVAAVRLDAEATLQALVGVAVVVAAVVLASGWRPAAETPAWEVGAGAASGALNAALGTGGPPVTLVLQARRMPPGQFRATVSVLFVVIDVAALVLLGVTGVVDGAAALAWLVALPGLAVGWWVGDRLHHRIDPARFRGAVLALLVASGVVAVAGALAG